MANLLGQDIGLNYKGLINIGSTINQNISASLQSLTDGDGNLLPLQISTTAVQLDYGVGIGGTPTTAGLHVYGQSGKTGLAFEGTSAKMYIDLNGTGTNFFDSVESRFRNAAGTSLVMNVWGDLGRVAIGGLATNFTPSATLHVRGDGTNPIFRGENGAGSTVLTVNNAGNLDALSFSIAGGSTITYAGGSATTVFGGGRYFRFDGNLSGGSVLTSQNGSSGVVSATSGTNNIMLSFANFAPAAGSSIFRLYNAQYTINASGAQTGNITGYFLNATETNLNGITHNLMDLQVGGTSRFRVINTGNIVIGDASAPSASKLNVAGDIFLRTNDSIGGGQTYPTVWNKIMLYNSSNGEMAITMYNISWFLRHNANMSIAGNTVIGTTTPSARLHVRGDGTNPIARFEDNAGTAVAFMQQNGRSMFGSNTPSVKLETDGTFRAWTQIEIGQFGSLVINTNSITKSATGSSFYEFVNGSAISATSASYYFLRTRNNFTVSSGSAVVDDFLMTPTINQTGTANGITRGLYVLPTLTSAVDFRAIEVKAGSTPAHKLLLLTDGSGNKVFEVNGKQEVGFFGSTPSGKLDVTGSRSNPEQALASLLTALATYGIIVDATTA